MDLQHGKDALTPQDIAQVEAQIGCELPAQLRAFYLQHNGGHCQTNLFMAEDEGYKINEFLPLKYGRNTLESTYLGAFLDNPLMPQNLVPFAGDAGGDYFCFATDDVQAGAIIFFESEYYDEPERALVFLAPSFSAFVAQLIVDPD